MSLVVQIITCYKSTSPQTRTSRNSFSSSHFESLLLFNDLPNSVDPPLSVALSARWRHSADVRRRRPHRRAVVVEHAGADGVVGAPVAALAGVEAERVAPVAAAQAEVAKVVGLAGEEVPAGRAAADGVRHHGVLVEVINAAAAAISALVQCIVRAAGLWYWMGVVVGVVVVELLLLLLGRDSGEWEEMGMGLSGENEKG